MLPRARGVRIKFYARFEPPKEVRRDGEIALLCKEVAFLADVRVDPVNFLDDQERRARLLGRPGNVERELTGSVRRGKW